MKSEVVPARAVKYSRTHLGFAKNIMFLSKHTSTELGCLGTSLTAIGVERLTNNTTSSSIRIRIGILCIIWRLVDVLILVSWYALM